MIGNKEVMASNIKYYMDKNHVNSIDVCRSLGFKQNTFSDWVNGKTYPRIDKIEKMARYFGVPKSCLVENQPVSYENRSDALNHFERELISAFRRADRITQDNICKLLDVKRDSISSKEA